MTAPASPRIIGLIVARTGSTRVPGKALIDIKGRAVLAHVIRLCKRIDGLAGLCLTTSTLPQDDPLVAIAEAEGIPIFRGDPELVLDRVYGAGLAHNADAIVYLGGDCPLMDPDVVTTAIAEFRATGCDYINNYDPPTFPMGLDVNVISMAALRIAFDRAIAPSQRIHPFSYLTFHPDDFSLRNFAQSPDLGTYHWALDYPEDLAFIRLVYDRLFTEDYAFRQQDVLDLIARDPEVAKVHATLIKPQMDHAFFSSPGMMRDFHADIITLCNGAASRLAEADYAGAVERYAEIYFLTKKLSGR